MTYFLLMLVIINPFAQILYLRELLDEMSPKEFIKLHLSASLISGLLFLIFAFGGDFIVESVFQIKLHSLQIFGGMIMLMVSYRYVVSGPGSNNFIRGDITDLAHQISLPYMVGPGTLWVSIQAGNKSGFITAAMIIASVLIVNFIFVVGYHWIVSRLKMHDSLGLTKYFGILMRTNAFLIGAVAVEMLITGLRAAFLN